MHAGTRRVTRWDERRAGMKKGGGGGGETLRTKRKNVKRKRRIAQQRWRFDLLLAPSRETVRGWLSVRMSIFGTSEPKFLLNEPDRKETLVLSPAAGRRLLSVRPESPLSSSVHLFNLKTLSVPAACGSPPLPHQVSERVRGHEGAALSHCKQSKPHSSWTVKTISVTNMSELLCCSEEPISWMNRWVWRMFGNKLTGYRLIHPDWAKIRYWGQNDTCEHAAAENCATLH